jgi:hypothetical protein
MNTSLKCPVDREHKVKALYASPDSKGWTKIDNHYFCYGCKKAYILDWKEIK